MVMDMHSLALAAAGLLGSAGAIVHGVLVQRLVVAPVQAATAGSRVVRRLAAPLLQFTTFNWFVGGLALALTAYAGGPQARLVAGLMVGSAYLYGAVGNGWATRGRHPGWVLYGVAVVLIGYGLA
jgi:hypothetical protein